MKRVQYLLLLLFTIWGLVACSYNELPEELSKMASPIETPIVLNVETRAETYDGKALDQNYFVSEADLENYVRYRRSATKQPNLTVKEVKSYGFDSSQTLFYILNYEKGWEVVSADKRVQPTLAYGDEGAFTMDCDNEPMKFWMNMLASGVLQTRQRTGDSAVATASTASKEESDKADEEQNVAFWNAISPTQQQNSRGEILIPTPGPLEPLEPIVYNYVVDTEVVGGLQLLYDELLQTEWGQGYPWNMYCPKISANSDTRAPAGCTAVAWAQILYYLATDMNMTISIPLEAVCPGDLVSGWSRLFDYYSSTSWDLLAKEYDSSSGREYTAALIAYTGYLSAMEYGANGSGAFPDTLIERINSRDGVYCTTNYNYNKNIVISCIRQNEPVLIWGSPEEDGGHTWVIDGYEKNYSQTITYYASFDTPQLPSYIATLDKEDADFSRTLETITSEKFHMNWGWSGSYDGWFACATSNWTPGSHNYPNVIEIIYGFEQH